MCNSNVELFTLPFSLCVCLLSLSLDCLLSFFCFLFSCPHLLPGSSSSSSSSNCTSTTSTTGSIDHHPDQVCLLLCLPFSFARLLSSPSSLSRCPTHLAEIKTNWQTNRWFARCTNYLCQKPPHPPFNVCPTSGLHLYHPFWTLSLASISLASLCMCVCV